jgi:hypothetical protein
MIKKLSYIFGSKTKAQEIVFLLNETKDVVRQGFYEHELEKIENFCVGNNLHFVKSKFKVLLMGDDYSNKGVRIKEEDKRKGMHFVYISKNEQKALLAAYYELIQNDKELGLLLGYPACCVRFFCENFNENNTNPELEPSNPLTNITKRDQDNVLLSHFPCDSDCKGSISIAKMNLHLLASLDKQRAEELFNSLR